MRSSAGLPVYLGPGEQTIRGEFSYYPGVSVSADGKMNWDIWSDIAKTGRANIRFGAIAPDQTRDCTFEWDDPSSTKIEGSTLGAKCEHTFRVHSDSFRTVNPTNIVSPSLLTVHNQSRNQFQLTFIEDLEEQQERPDWAPSSGSYHKAKLVIFSEPFACVDPGQSVAHAQQSEASPTSVAETGGQSG